MTYVNQCDRCLKVFNVKLPWCISDTIGHLCYKCEKEWMKYQEY